MQKLDVFNHSDKVHKGNEMNGNKQKIDRDENKQINK